MRKKYHLISLHCISIAWNLSQSLFLCYLYAFFLRHSLSYTFYVISWSHLDVTGEKNRQSNVVAASRSLSFLVCLCHWCHNYYYDINVSTTFTPFFHQIFCADTGNTCHYASDELNWSSYRRRWRKKKIQSTIWFMHHSRFSFSFKYNSWDGQLLPYSLHVFALFSIHLTVFVFFRSFYWRESEKTRTLYSNGPVSVNIFVTLCVSFFQ